MKKILMLLSSISLVVSIGNFPFSCGHSYSNDGSIELNTNVFDLNKYTTFNRESIVTFLKDETGLRKVFFADEHKGQDPDESFIYINKVEYDNPDSRLDNFILDLSGRNELANFNHLKFKIHLAYQFNSVEEKQIDAEIDRFFDTTIDFTINNLQNLFIDNLTEYMYNNIFSAQQKKIF